MLVSSWWKSLRNVVSNWTLAGARPPRRGHRRKQTARLGTDSLAACERLEDRTLLATYTWNGTDTLDITLGTNEDLTVADGGGGTTTFTIDTGSFTQSGGSVAPGDGTAQLSFLDAEYAVRIQVRNTGAGAGTNDVDLTKPSLATLLLDVNASQAGTTSAIDVTATVQSPANGVVTLTANNDNLGVLASITAPGGITLAGPTISVLADLQTDGGNIALTATTGIGFDASVVIDSESGADNDAGQITLSAPSVSSGLANTNLLLDASTSAASNSSLVSLASATFDNALGNTIAGLSATGGLVALGTISAGSVTATLTAPSNSLPPVIAFNANVTTTGLQTYDGLAQINANVTLTSTTDAVLFLRSIIDDGAAGTPSNLVVNAATASLFRGYVGVNPANLADTTARINGLRTDVAPALVSGTTIFDLDTVALPGTPQFVQFNGTADTQFNDAVVIFNPIVLTSVGNGANVVFANTLNADSSDDTLVIDKTAQAGSAVFVGEVGGVVSLGELQVFAPAIIIGGLVSTAGQQVYAGTLTLGIDTLMFSGGDVRLLAGANGVAAGLQTLFINAIGAVELDGSIGNVVLLETLFVASNSLELANGTISTTGFQFFSNSSTLIDGNVVLNSTSGGDIAFTGSVGGVVLGNSFLTVNTAGNTLFAGPIDSLVTPLTALTTDAPAAPPANRGGQTRFANGTVNTTGPQAYHDPVRIEADTTFTASAVTFHSTLDSFDANLRRATINTSGGGITTFNGNVGTAFRLFSLTTNADGTTVLNAPQFLLAGNSATFNDPVIVAIDTLVDEDVGNVTFNNTVDDQVGQAGQHSLTVATFNGETIFAGIVGGTRPLRSLLTRDEDANPVSGVVRINTNGITTTGNQRYEQDVEIGANAILTSSSGGDIDFVQVVNDTVGQQGQHTLELRTDGVIFVRQDIGGDEPLATLTTSADSTARFSGPDFGGFGNPILTNGNQTFAGQVILDTNTSFASLAGGNLTFDTVDGSRRLGLYSNGLITMTDLVGGTTPLGDGIGDAIVIAAGDVRFLANVTVQGSVVLASEDLNDNGVLDLFEDADGDGTLDSVRTVTGDTTFPLFPAVTVTLVNQPNAPVFRVRTSTVHIDLLQITGGAGATGDGVHLDTNRSRNDVHITRSSIFNNDHAGVWASVGANFHNGLIVQESGITNNAIGIGLGSARGALIGDNTDPTLGNTIRDNSLVGVTVVNAGSDGNTIRHNTIDGNYADKSAANVALESRSTYEHGIDLGDNGFTPNDVVFDNSGSGGSDADAGANNLQNSPTLVHALYDTATRELTVLFHVPSSLLHSFYDPLTGISVDIHALLPDLFGIERMSLVGTASVLGTEAQQMQVATFTLPVGNPLTIADSRITALATDGFGNTSEFSVPILVQGTAQLILDENDVITPSPTVTGTDNGSSLGNLGFFIVPFNGNATTAVEFAATNGISRAGNADNPADPDSFGPFFNNELGLYPIDNQVGTVSGIASEPNSQYAAAVRNVHTVIRTTADALNAGANLPTNRLFGSYMVRGATLPDMLIANPDNSLVSPATDGVDGQILPGKSLTDTPVAFFSFTDANPDQFPVLGHKPGEYRHFGRVFIRESDGAIVQFWEESLKSAANPVIVDGSISFGDYIDEAVVIKFPELRPVVIPATNDSIATVDFKRANPKTVTQPILVEAVIQGSNLPATLTKTAGGLIFTEFGLVNGQQTPQRFESGTAIAANTFRLSSGRQAVVNAARTQITFDNGTVWNIRNPALLSNLLNQIGNNFPFPNTL